MIKLLVAIGLITECLSFFIYNRILFSPKKRMASCVLTYVISYVSLILLHDVSSYHTVIINMILFLLVNIFILLFLYKISLLSAILHAFFISGISIISELLVGYIYSLFNDFYWNNWNSLHNLTYMTLSVLVFAAITISAALVEKKIKTINNINAALIVVAILGCITIMAIVASFVFNFIVYPDSVTEAKNINITNIIVLNILLFGFVFIHFYLYRTAKTLGDEKQQKQIEKDNADFVRELRDRDNAQRILIHDIKKHLNAIQAMAQNNNTKGIEAYVEKLTSSSALAPPIRYCTNDYINSILFKYQRESERRNIKFSVTSTSADYSFIENYDITIIMCNLLDNALEAATQSDNAYINITLTQDIEKNISMIVIVNSCSNVVKFVQGIPVSNKHDVFSHGLGIKSVLEVLEKYDGNINMYQDDNNDYHTVVLLNWGEIHENSNL